MDVETHDRRRRIRELLIYEDVTPSEIIDTITEEFATDRETIENDLDTVADWLYELDLLRDVQGISLLAELRRNRQRLHRMADDANAQGELTEERKIRAEINRSISLERQISDSSLQTVQKSPPKELEHMEDLMR